MAGSLNRAQLIGHLGADPEIRRTQDGPPASGRESSRVMSKIDWGNFEGPNRNIDWKPDLQDLIYTAINFRDEEWGDADEDAGQQIVERLLAALRDEHFDKAMFNAHRHELLEKIDRGAVATKVSVPLKWTRRPPPDRDEVRDSLWADGIGGRYQAVNDGTLWYAHDEVVVTMHLSQAAAKAVAQKDFDRRLNIMLRRASRCAEGATNV